MSINYQLIHWKRYNKAVVVSEQNLSKGDFYYNKFDKKVRQDLTNNNNNKESKVIGSNYLYEQEQIITIPQLNLSLVSDKLGILNVELISYINAKTPRQLIDNFNSLIN